jgi:hypothetical protein
MFAMAEYWSAKCAASLSAHHNVENHMHALQLGDAFVPQHEPDSAVHPGLLWIGPCDRRLACRLPFSRARPEQAAILWQTAFFDVLLHDNFHHVSKRGVAYDLCKIFDNTVVKARPGNAVTFVDKHE